MERVIENVATGLGNTVGFLAESGTLFVVFALLWITFGVALVFGNGTVDAAWEAIRDLPLVVEGLVWVLFLPVMAGLWVWESALPVLLRALLVMALAGWTLLVFPKPWK